LVDQAVRTCTNVKNRQTREEEKGIELVEHLIKDNNMMDHKVLLFLLEPGQIKAEIRGLVANKIMARYQRPCCMLTKRVVNLPLWAPDKTKEYWTPFGDVCHGEWKTEQGDWVNHEIITYEGSARGCDKVGVTEFKDICAATGVCDYTVGHQGAFGLGITAGCNNEQEGEVFGENIYQFLDKTDEILKDMPNEPIYYVDYIWDYKNADTEKILEIADLAPYIGKDIDEPLVAIRGIQITKDMLTMMASNTLKITLPNGVPIIKFRMPDEEYEKLISKTGYVEIDAICRCNKNEWNGNISAQLLLEDYEIIGGCAYVF
jgi:single-stranded-DNA-specific exonuclease